MSIYTSNTKSVKTKDGFFTGSIKEFSTLGINFDISVDNITTTTVDLNITVNSITGIDGGVFVDYIDNNFQYSRTIDSTGTYTVTEKGLSKDTTYEYKVNFKYDGDIIQTKTTTFTTKSEANIDIKYTTEMNFDYNNDINITPILNVLYDSTNDINIEKYELLDNNNNVVFSTNNDSQLSVSKNSARKAEYETITFTQQTSNSDIISKINLLDSLDNNIVNVNLNEDINGDQRIEIIIPIKSN